MQSHSLAAAVVSFAIVVYFARLPPPEAVQRGHDKSGLVQGLWLSTQFPKVDPTDRRCKYKRGRSDRG